MIFEVLAAADRSTAWLYFAGALGGGYLLGSIPFGLIFTRLAGLGDIRNVGSGNIGATNVLRTGNRYIAAATLVCDAGKGAVAVMIASGDVFRWVGAPAPWGGQALEILAAFGAFAGHIFPVWLGFKGGKGVATFLGTLLALNFIAGLIACATWLVTAAATRISSLSALVAAALSPIVLAAFSQYQLAVLAGTLTLMIAWSHRENIARLLRGEEPRIGASKR